MQFKNPEILYFLFLLVLPILVHLFQLRKFKKEYFTNVKLLKELQIQTRKSKTIKKWLLLITRLFLLTCLITAFAQPFFTAKDTENRANELVILVDNSFSMQAKGEKGELLKSSIYDILKNLPENQTFSLVTNTETFWDTDSKTIRKEIQNIDYSPIPFEPDFLLEQIELKKPKTKKDYIIISDGINVEAKKIKTIAEKNQVYFIQPKATKKTNIAIEKVTINQSLDAFYEILIALKAYGTIENEIALMVSNENEVIAKSQITFDKPEKELKITIPKKAFHGKIEIQDAGLTFDNTYFFSITEPKKRNVTSIGTEENNTFIRKILTNDEFNVTTVIPSQLDFNSIDEQQIIVLNEVEVISQTLATTLQSFYKNGGTIIIIPAIKSNLQNLNASLQKIGNFEFADTFNFEKQIIKINFEHPIYRNVFEKKITNFQYPKVAEGFTIKGNTNTVLEYEDKTSFLSSIGNQIGKIYVFTAPINKKNSNFQNSPLIVPTFYNMAIASGSSILNTFTITENESMIIAANLSKDEVVTIKNDQYSFIPNQQIQTNKVKLNFGDYPEIAGNYKIQQKNKPLQDISFNYSRNESDITNDKTIDFKYFTKIDSVSDALNILESKRSDTMIWKWFLIATLLFIITELLIQKFIK